ncbi:hypothetical protein [Streptosporangium sp. NPDC049304]|uniref:hypothetical protein n=1 Tax=Streptosporangium sp. NPDC049304 TaxID=3154830 RepID=UPI00343D3ACF
MQIAIPRPSLRTLLITVIIVIAVVHGPDAVTPLLTALALCLSLLMINTGDRADR